MKRYGGKMFFKRKIGNNLFGFSFIELLLVLLFISLLAYFSTKSLRKNLMKGEGGQNYLTIENVFKDAIESRRGLVIKEADLDNFVYRIDQITDGFRLVGTKPFARIEKSDKGNWKSIAENVANIRFTYYNSGGDLILDQDAKQKPEDIKRIKISIWIHNGKEDTSYFADDGVNGIDLDGDKTNGVARLKEINFVVDIK